MDNVQIYKMTMSDLDAISDTLFSDFDDFWTISTLKNELQNPNSQYIIAKLNNEIVGFGGIWKAVDDIHITDIVVKKIFRRQNIGSIILKQLISLAEKQNITSITLEVNSINIPAQKLYEKIGFKKVGLRKKYYNNTDDAIIYTKDLTDANYKN